MIVFIDLNIQSKQIYSMKKYLLFSAAWIGLWGYTTYKVILSSLPYNPFSPEYKEKIRIMTFIPEGWGFFTRNPREPDLHLFILKNNRWVKNPNMPISNFRNAMGLSRLPRAQSVEIAMLISKVKENDWKTSELNINNLELKNPSIITIKELFPYAILKDTLCIVQQAPIPWAWSWNRSVLKMPSKYIVINVRDE